MTDRTDKEILEDFVATFIEIDIQNDIIKDVTRQKIESVLTQLRAHYREKIRRVGIARIIESKVTKKGVWKCSIQDLATAILKEIDKELK